MFVLFVGCFVNWVVAITFYALKLFVERLNTVTSYGKFQPSTTRNLFFPISNKAAWALFYAIGLCWNTCLIYLASGNMKMVSFSHLNTPSEH